MDLAVIGFGISINLAETGEICILFQDIAGRLHGCKIQFPKYIMGQVSVEYLLPSVYDIFIGPAQGTETGMCIRGNRYDLVDGNISWQFLVDPEEKILIPNRFFALIRSF